MKKLIPLICMGFTFVYSVSTVSAAVVFTEDFEGGNLSQWVGKNGGAHHGVIVDDPDSSSTDHAMNFSQTNAAGDIFSSVTAFAAGDYWLSFDYFGDTEMYNAPNSDTGGYVGISQGFPDSHQWFWATGTVSGASDVLVDDNSWHSYTFAFTSSVSFHLMLEDFSGSGGGAGDAYFDNIRLSDTNPVPEPATMFLFGTGLAGLIGSRIKKKK